MIPPTEWMSGESKRFLRRFDWVCLSIPAACVLIIIGILVAAVVSGCADMKPEVESTPPRFERVETYDYGSLYHYRDRQTGREYLASIKGGIIEIERTQP